MRILDWELRGIALRGSIGMTSGLVAAVVLALGLVVAGAANAQHASDAVRLAWSAPEGCPDREDVLRAIDAWLADAHTFDASLRVQARITAHAAGDYALFIAWSGAEGAGERNLASESCEAAADTAAWLIALALQRAPEVVSEPAPQDAPGLRYELAVRGLVDFGTLPSTAVGALAELGLVLSAFHLDLAAAYFPGNSVSVGAVRTETDLAEVSLAACYLVDAPRFVLGPCLRGTLGRMSVVARELPVRNQGAARSQALAAGMQLRARLYDTLWLVSEADLAWNQRRPLFALRDGSTIHQARSVALRLGLGVMVLLP